MNGTYLIAPSRHPVIHLTVWAHDRQEHMGDSLSWATGRSVPLCGQDRGREWQITGTWAQKWPKHSTYAICRRCRHVANQIDAELSCLEPTAR